MKYTSEVLVRIAPEHMGDKEQIIARYNAALLSSQASKLPPERGWLTMHFEVREPEPFDPLVGPHVKGGYVMYHRLTIYERSIKP